MNAHASPIVVVPLGSEPSVAARLTVGIAAAFGRACQIAETPFDAVVAFDPARGQYRSTTLLQGLASLYPWAHRILGVTPVDLFVPVLTFVYGEAQVGGRCAVVSSFRLREECYGLPRDGELTMERLLKEAVHELGHTFGLRHCDDWTCVMHSTHTVERLDLKTAVFCERCRTLCNRESV